MLNACTHYINTEVIVTDPVIIIDGPAGVVKFGEPLNLTCYALNSTGMQLQWLKDGKLLSVGASGGELIALTTITYSFTLWRSFPDFVLDWSTVFTVPEADTQDSGLYSCQLQSASTLLESGGFNVTVASKSKCV